MVGSVIWSAKAIWLKELKGTWLLQVVFEFRINFRLGLLRFWPEVT